MKRWIGMALALACAMMAVAVPALAIELDNCRVSYCDEYVTMRAKASTSAPAVTYIPYGAWVEDVSCNSYGDAFYHCSYNGRSGYVLSKYLLGGQECAEIEGAHVVNCDAWVSLRARPKTSAARLIKVPYGAQLSEAYYVENGFVHCFYGGLEGYILSRYVDYGF